MTWTVKYCVVPSALASYHIISYHIMRRVRAFDATYLDVTCHVKSRSLPTLNPSHVMSQMQHHIISYRFLLHHVGHDAHESSSTSPCHHHDYQIIKTGGGSSSSGGGDGNSSREAVLTVLPPYHSHSSFYHVIPHPHTGPHLCLHLVWLP